MMNGSRFALPVSLLLLLAALFFLLTPAVQAQSGGGYELTWSTIDSGGAQSLSGSTYTLNGTTGQPDAGTQSGGGYTLAGGFWVELFGGRVFLPLSLK